MLFHLHKAHPFTLTRNSYANAFHSVMSFNNKKLVLFIYLY